MRWLFASDHDRTLASIRVSPWTGRADTSKLGVPEVKPAKGDRS